MDKMKTIGLIGGMSWESSKMYYEYVNKGVKSELGGSHSAKSIMSSVDFDEIEKLTFENDWGKIGDLMALHATKLEMAGADMILLCTNTIHLVSAAITSAVEIPFLHIANATGEALKKANVRKVGLLGTRFTMERDFYTKILKESYHLEVITPGREERQVLHDIIYNELVKGEFKETSKQAILQIIKDLEKEGIEGIILGCTELPLLISPGDVSVPTFNTTAIHAQEAVKWALGN